MQGMYAQYATTYLWILGSVTTLTFAIPLFVTPISWARILRWKLPEEKDLTVYFGRCLGAFILLVEYFIFKAAFTGESVEFTFEVLTLVFSFMLAVHIYGALRRIQPITETLEIGLWMVVLTINYLCYPA